MSNTSRPALKMYALGHDAEFFVVDGKGKAVPPHEWYPLEPPPIRGFGDGLFPQSPYYATFVDGMQAEINVTPSTCREEVIGSTKKGLLAAYDKLPPDYHLVAAPVIRVSPKALKGVPKAFEWGCDPIENAYQEQVEPPNLRKLPLRFAGGHIHMSMSLPKSADFDPWDFARWLDRTVGIMAVALSAKQRKVERIRRKFCGRAGDFRVGKVEPYWMPPNVQFVRMEYRVPSNFWLTSQWLMHIMFGAVRQAMYTYPMAEDIPQLDAREIINSCDTKAARTEAKRLGKWWMDCGMSLEEMEFSRRMREAYTNVLFRLLHDPPNINQSLLSMSKQQNTAPGFMFSVRMLASRLRRNGQRPMTSLIAAGLREGEIA